MVYTSDRISAFDYILDPEIPGKGKILTDLTYFYLKDPNLLGIKNHLVSNLDDPRIPEEIKCSSMIVKKLEMIPFECVARGYLTGSAMVEYQKTGEICGIKLPSGLVEGSKLPEPIFTPATKAPLGMHDENVTFSEVENKIGSMLANSLRQSTVDVYLKGAKNAQNNGLILADTKFEFGLDSNGELVLADEVLTPDSSRYWDLEKYNPGNVQPSFDKQILRNWLLFESGWNKSQNQPPPKLSPQIVELTRQKYLEVTKRLTSEQ